MDATEDLLTQHIKSSSRARGTDPPAVLDLLFTRQDNQLENIDYETPMGKSNHIIMQGNFIVKYDKTDKAETEDKEKNEKL